MTDVVQDQDMRPLPALWCPRFEVSHLPTSHSGFVLAVDQACFLPAGGRGGHFGSERQEALTWAMESYQDQGCLCPAHGTYSHI